jgi:hypothetical protein
MKYVAGFVGAPVVFVGVTLLSSLTIRSLVGELTGRSANWAGARCLVLGLLAAVASFRATVYRRAQRLPELDRHYGNVADDRHRSNHSH